MIAVVIYLFDEKNMPDCPLRWPGLNETTALVFQYLIIQMKDLSREEFLALGEPGLWPLALLTKGKVDRILVEEMFTDLLEQKLYNILPIGHTIAAWFLHGDDLSWLHEEYLKMHEIFRDSPARQWMEASAREEERRKAQLQLQEAQKKAEQQLRAEQKKAEQRLLAAYRKMVTGIVGERFPTLQSLAKAQVGRLKDPELFQQIVLRLSLARDVDEAQKVLLACNGDKNAGADDMKTTD